MAGDGGRAPVWVWVVGVLVVTAVAGILRLHMPGPTILTVDELNWQSRSANWEWAWEQREFGEMVAAESGRDATRPGVTTMWTGYLAKELMLADAPGFSSVDRLGAAHRLMAIWCTLLLIPFMVIGSRLVTRRGALVAGGILAVEPLLVGHSALLHTDALVTMTGAVATVALLATFDEVRRNLGREPRSWWTRADIRLGATAGTAAALAVLTKVSALVPLGAAAVAALALHCWLVLRSHGSFRQLLRTALPAVVVPTAVASVVVVLLWPALWVTPVSAVSDALSSFGLADQATPRFFLGEVITGRDWRYYGVELVFRSSAWLLLAMPLAAGWVIWRRQSGRPPVMSRRNGAALVASGVVYTAGIVTASKQYARYLLPLLPLAALALGAVAEDLVRSLKHWYHRQRRRMPRLVPSALGLGALALCATYTFRLAPYQISHVNQLVGGQRVAERTIPLGWGEGREQVTAAYQRSGTCEPWAAVGVFMTACLRERQDFAFLEEGEDPPRFVLRYVFQAQLGLEPEGLGRYLESNATRVSAVAIDGVVYAEMWEIETESTE